MPTPERSRCVPHGPSSPGRMDSFAPDAAARRPYLFRVPVAGTERNDGQFQGNRGNLRRQAVKSSDEVSDTFRWATNSPGDKSGLFSEQRNGACEVSATKSCPVLELNADVLHRAETRGAYCFVLGDRQRLAPYWQAEPAPTMAGRSHAACFGKRGFVWQSRQFMKLEWRQSEMKTE